MSYGYSVLASSLTWEPGEAFLARMPMSESLKEVTRKEWRALGFYYTRDDGAGQAWRIVGSLAGLTAFHATLVRYVASPGKAPLSEHEHYGPYMYLKIMTWNEAGIDAGSIHGTIADLSRLAELVRVALAVAKPGDVIPLGHSYVERPSHELLLEVREEGFDPASADPELA